MIGGDARNRREGRAPRPPPGSPCAARLPMLFRGRATDRHFARRIVQSPERVRPGRGNRVGEVPPMTPKDFSTSVTDRLQRRGAWFRQEDLEAFLVAALLRERERADPDVWAERFLAEL